MTAPRNLGQILLGIWLVLTGLVQLLGIGFAGLGVLMGLLALIAGALILMSATGKTLP
jgi:hypothetical protein